MLFRNPVVLISVFISESKLLVHTRQWHPSQGKVRYKNMKLSNDPTDEVGDN